MDYCHEGGDDEDDALVVDAQESTSEEASESDAESKSSSLDPEGEGEFSSCLTETCGVRKPQADSRPPDPRIECPRRLVPIVIKENAAARSPSVPKKKSELKVPFKMPPKKKKGAGKKNGKSTKVKKPVAKGKTKSGGVKKKAKKKKKGKKKKSTKK